MKPLKKFAQFLVLIAIFTGTPHPAALTVALAAAPADTLIYCSEANPSALNPITTLDGASINLLSQIYESLVALDPKTGEPTPRLATRWTANADGTRYVFELKKNVRFHASPDFTPTRTMNADDVVFSLNRFLDPAHPFHKVGKGYPSFLSVEMDKILGSVKKLDDYRVEVNLKQAYAPFLTNFSSIQVGAIFSAEYGAQLVKAGKLADLDSKPIGTGPFRFESFRQDQLVRLLAHPEYHRGPARVGKVVFAITPDPATRVQKLRTGECDVVFQPSPQDIDALKTTPNVRLEQKLGLNFGFLAFNSKKPPLDNPKVRQALAHALNRASYQDAIYGGKAKAIAAPLPYGSWAQAVATGAPEYNPEKARALLKEAGFPDGFTTTLWALPVTRPYIPNGKKLAELMQADLAKVGVKAKITTFEWGTYLEKATKHEHDLLQLGLTLLSTDPDSALFLNFSCTSAKSGENPSAWCNEKFDEKIQAARRALDRKARLKLYREALKILAAETPVAPLFTNQITHALSTRIANYEPAFNGDVDFYRAEFTR